MGVIHQQKHFMPVANRCAGSNIRHVPEIVRAGDIYSRIGFLHQQPVKLIRVYRTPEETVPFFRINPLHIQIQKSCPGEKHTVRVAPGENFCATAFFCRIESGKIQHGANT